MTKTLGVLLSLGLAACAGQAEVRYSGPAARPDLVTMDSDPSVMVVANADEPVFYSENTYWLYRDQHWYRSHSHRGGWARVDHPPEHVQRIQQPANYIHFRGETRAAHNERARLAEPSRPTAAEEVAPRRDRPDDPLGPRHEPNPQGPGQPYSNPLPPHQVPPVPDPDRVNGDPARAPQTPGMRNRGADQRPAADRDDRRDRGPAPDAPPAPIR